MKATGYCRVSSMDQIDGTSLQSQEKQIRQYAAMRGIELLDVLVDAGVSGGKPLALRPAGARLVDAVNTKATDAVIVAKLDRGFRSASDCLVNLEAWERLGVNLHIVDMGGASIDTSTTMGKFMLTVLAASAEMERGVIRDRCNAGRAARRAQNQCIGGLPFGYELAVDGKTLIECADEQQAISLAQQLRDNGRSASQIAAELNRRGLHTKKGKTWTHTQVIRILKKAA